MSLVFADPTLRQVADSGACWYHYVVPELQTYWTVRVLVAPGVLACVIADMIDLPRLTCYVLEGEHTARQVLERFGLGARVKYVESLKCAKQKRPWDHLIARSNTASETRAVIPHTDLITVGNMNPPA
ncbi:MAG: hypothetical protein WAM39_29080 [Bryobacteraceae bacterium]